MNKAKSNGHTFKVENDIPIPGGGSSKSGFAAAIRNLKIGQSVLNNKSSSPGSISAQAASVAFRAGDGRRYVTRTVEGGTRVWRVA